MEWNKIEISKKKKKKETVLGPDLSLAQEAPKLSRLGAVGGSRADQ